MHGQIQTNNIYSIFQSFPVIAQTFVVSVLLFLMAKSDNVNHILFRSENGRAFKTKNVALVLKKYCFILTGLMIKKLGSYPKNLVSYQTSISRFKEILFYKNVMSFMNCSAFLKFDMTSKICFIVIKLQIKISFDIIRHEILVICKQKRSDFIKIGIEIMKMISNFIFHFYQKQLNKKVISIFISL